VDGVILTTVSIAKVSIHVTHGMLVIFGRLMGFQ